jgi:hypothetical protein
MSVAEQDVTAASTHTSRPGWLGLGLFACFITSIWVAWFSGYPAPGHGPALLVIPAALALMVRLRQGWAPGWTLRDPLPWALLLVLWPLLVAFLRTGRWEHGGALSAYRLAAVVAALAVLSWRERLPHLPAALGQCCCWLLVLGVIGTIGTGANNWGTLLRLGQEAPFGNPNFVVGAAIGGLALAWAGIDKERPTSWTVPSLGTLAALALGSGLLHYVRDRVDAVWVASAVMIGCAGIVLLMPKRRGLALGLAAGAYFLVQFLFAIDFERALWFGPSGVSRAGMWQGAVQAWLASPLWGYGVGEAGNVIPEQSNFWPAWLAVPSFPENAHHLVLQQALDGGLIQLGLLGALLWRLPRQLSPAALCCLAGALALLCLESHAGQPGPLLLLGLLAGACLTPAPTPPQARSQAPGLILATGAMLAATLAWSAGFAERGHITLQWEPARRAAEAATAAGDHATAARIWRELETRIGPCDDIPSRIGIATGRSGNGDSAARILLDQARRLPVEARTMDLLGKLAESGRVDSETISNLQSQARDALKQSPAECPASTSLADVLGP